jgi:hypothetical protein
VPYLGGSWEEGAKFPAAFNVLPTPDSLNSKNLRLTISTGNPPSYYLYETQSSSATGWRRKGFFSCAFIFGNGAIFMPSSPTSLLLCESPSNVLLQANKDGDEWLPLSLPFPYRSTQAITAAIVNGVIVLTASSATTSNPPKYESSFYLSNDSGTTWASTFAANAAAVKAAGAPGRGFAVVGSKQVWYSSDGNSWTTKILFTKDRIPQAAALSGSGILHMVGSFGNGDAYYTQANQNGNILSDTVIKSCNVEYRPSFVSDKIVIVGCAMGTGWRVEKTLDGGTTFSPIAKDTSGTGPSVSFSDEMNGWLFVRTVASPYVALYRTSDGGTNWISVPLP